MARSVLCVMGPTASGKTALAYELYDAFDAELISVDSSLVYKQMDIGTAKPSKDELLQYPHHLVDILSPTESFSASQFEKEAHRLCDDILGRGKLPILVGGTMLYFKAFQQGLDDLPETDENVRKKLQQRLDSEGLVVLHDELKRVDAVSAQRIHQNDTQRVLRALEVFAITGKPISDFWSKQEVKQAPYDFINIALIPADRAKLHQRIEQRFDAMLEAGFVDEVRALIKQGITIENPSQRAVGYRQVHQYLNGDIDKEIMRQKGIVASRQLAKRQLTWLRHYPDVQAIDPFTEGCSLQVNRFIEELLF